MQVITRVPGLRRWRRTIGRWKRRLTVRRVAVAIEVAALALTLGVLLSGARAAYLDRLGRRADAVVVAATLAVFGVIHLLAFRRVVPSIEQQLAPPAYDEHRVLLDLSQESRAAQDVDQLYSLVVRRIGEVLKTEAVSILVRDDDTGEYVCRMATDAESTIDSLSPDTFVVRRLRGLATPLHVGPEDLDTWERAFDDASPQLRERRRNESGALRRAGVRLLVQIRTRDQLVGILMLGARATRHAYTDADREMLLLAASQLALIIGNEKLVEKAVTEERLRRELALAAEVQRRLLPEGAPIVAGIELSGACQPARGVGGDYYDFIDLGGDRTGIAIADVSGKGISAALVMSSVQAYLRSHAVSANGSIDRLGDLVAKINLLLCRSTGAATYVTFFYAQYDAEARRLTYVNAGHNPPMLLRARNGGTPYALTSGGPVVGIFEAPGFEQESIDLETGDILVAYTDGVTEALDEEGEEFGEERLLETINAATDLTADDIRDAVLRRVHEWSAGAPQHDDLTLVITKVR